MEISKQKFINYSIKLVQNHTLNRPEDLSTQEFLNSESNEKTNFTEAIHSNTHK